MDKDQSHNVATFEVLKFSILRLPRMLHNIEKRMSCKQTIAEPFKMNCFIRYGKFYFHGLVARTFKACFGRFGILFAFPYQGGVSKNRSALFND